MSQRSTEVVKIQADNSNLEFLYAFPDQHQGQSLPTILVFHAWAGRDAFTCDKAIYFASQGFLGIAVDLFGDAIVGGNTQECQKLIQPFVSNRSYLKQRLLTIINFLKDDPRVDSNQINAIGYCFGGLCVLDMVRNNLGLKGAISVHGLLFKPDYALPTTYSAKVAVLHGHKDPMIPFEQLVDFQQEMDQSVADWQFLSFGQGLHAFTLPTANNPALGTVYNPLLAQRTTNFVDQFWQELIG